MVHSSPNSHRARCAKLQNMNIVIDGPPTLYKRCSSSLKPMHILLMLCHGGKLKVWCDIGRFFASWGCIKISLNNTSTGILQNWQQPWTSSQHRWIHHFFIIRAHVNHPIFVAQHSQTSRMHQSDKHSSHCLFLLRKVISWADISIPVIWLGRRLVVCCSWLLYCTSLTNKSLKLCGHAEITWCSKMLSKWNDCWLLHVMNEYILFYSLITQPVSHPSAFLFTSRHNNQPLEIWNRMLRSNVSSRGTGWLRYQQNWAQLGFKQGYDKAD